MKARVMVLIAAAFGAPSFGDLVSLEGDSGWTVWCAQDEMDDGLHCTIHQQGPNGTETPELWVTYTPHTRGVSVGGDQRFPGKEQLFRVDDNPALATSAAGLAGAEADQLLAQAAMGSVLRTRYYRWPDSTQIDRVVKLSGFAEADGAARAILANAPVTLSADLARKNRAQIGSYLGRVTRYIEGKCDVPAQSAARIATDDFLRLLAQEDRAAVLAILRKMPKAVRYPDCATALAALKSGLSSLDALVMPTNSEEP